MMFEVFYNFCGLNQEIFLFLNKITNIGLIPYFLRIISFCFNIANFALIYILYCIYLYIQLKKIKNDNERQNKFWHNYNKLVEVGIIYATFGLIFTFLKFSINLPRPYCSLPIDSFVTIINTANERCLSSFPSSHAALSVLVTYFIWNYIKLPIKILMICAIILVSLSRISLAMHYPSDIIYGIIIGFIAILAGKLIYLIFANKYMLLYRKYFIKNILPLLIVVTFSITSIVWITQVLKLLYLFDKGIKVMDFFGLIILVLPTLLFILLPVITVITVIYIYNNLKIERQLIILQASGVNNLYLALPALYIALIVTLLAYYISSTIMPLSHINLKSRLSFIKNNYISSMIEEKTFNKITKDVTVYIDKKSAGNVMSGVIIFDNSNADNPSVVFADSGILDIYENNPVFELSKGIRQEYDENGNLTQLTFDSLMIKLQNDNPLISQRTKHNKEANEYYIKELLKPPADLSLIKKIKLIAEAHQRIIWPLYNFVLPFLALAIFLKYPYSKKTTFIPILFTALSILIVTSIHFILQNFASKNLVFVSACYFNVFLILATGLYLFVHKRM